MNPIYNHYKPFNFQMPTALGDTISDYMISLIF